MRSRVKALTLAATLGLLACGAVGAAEGQRTAPLFKDLGNYHHPVTTSSPEAQKFFDQGLILMYGFNHAEAVRSFKEAARLDPGCAMCYWGASLALGPNINKPMDEADVPEAHELAVKAMSAADAGHATPAEKAYIEALSKRYSDKGLADRAERDKAYADAMRGVASRFPDDLDASVLFAEALMDTMPWNYYEKNGDPKSATVEVTNTLERVLRKDPGHPGAIHFYIHAVEASSTPKRAEAYADRLRGMIPGAGHLVHMPSHIYLRVGRYDDAVEVNVQAAAADESYIDQCNAQGFYPALYYPHNIHFLWFSASLQGRSKLAIDTSRRLVSKVPEEMIDKVPALQQFKPIPYFTLVRFGHWDEIQKEPEPSAKWTFVSAMWHYAQGMAAVRTGKTKEAREHAAELGRLAGGKEMKAIEADDFPAIELGGIAGLILDAEIAGAEGKTDRRIRLLTQAVQAQDDLPYTEPPYWYYPVRQSLGAVLLEAGKPEDAEAVYRKDLENTPHNGWSLFGLAQSLKAQGKEADATAAISDFGKVWARADIKLAASAF